MFSKWTARMVPHSAPRVGLPAPQPSLLSAPASTVPLLSLDRGVPSAPFHPETPEDGPFPPPSAPPFFVNAFCVFACPCEAWAPPPRLALSLVCTLGLDCRGRRRPVQLPVDHLARPCISAGMVVPPRAACATCPLNVFLLPLLYLIAHTLA